ncbi:unnamed protein product, partial [Owenia fusiformis]
MEGNAEHPMRVADIPKFWLEKTMTKLHVNDLNKNGIWDAEDMMMAADNIIRIGNLTGAAAEKVRRGMQTISDTASHFKTATSLEQWLVEEYKLAKDIQRSTFCADIFATSFFEIFNIDSDGFVSMDAFMTYWRAYNLDPDFAYTQFAYMDTNRDGKISK